MAIRAFTGYRVHVQQNYLNALFVELELWCKWPLFFALFFAEGLSRYLGPEALDVGYLEFGHPRLPGSHLGGNADWVGSDSEFHSELCVYQLDMLLQAANVPFVAGNPKLSIVVSDDAQGMPRLLKTLFGVFLGGSLDVLKTKIVVMHRGRYGVRCAYRQGSSADKFDLQIFPPGHYRKVAARNLFALGGITPLEFLYRRFEIGDSATEFGVPLVESCVFFA